MQLVDTHCHLFLEPLATNGEAVLQRARQAGVERLVVPAYDLGSWPRVAELGTIAGVAVAFGVHPWVAHEPLRRADLDAVLRQHRAVAVGEVGLDYAIDDVDRARQHGLLALQLDVAQQRNLPVILHCRNAFDDLLALLEPRAPVHGVLHAYSRGPELAARFVALGLHIAFGGAITRPTAERARRAARGLPRERLLLETDAPSIGLDGVAAHDTEPYHVAAIAQALATVRGEGVDAVAAYTTANAVALFALGEARLAANAVP